MRKTTAEFEAVLGSISIYSSTFLFYNSTLKIQFQRTIQPPYNMNHSIPASKSTTLRINYPSNLISSTISVRTNETPYTSTDYIFFICEFIATGIGRGILIVILHYNSQLTPYPSIEKEKERRNSCPSNTTLSYTRKKGSERTTYTQ